jgi:hypothetical protein
MPKLLIKFPTRNRPEKFKKVLQLYIDGLSGKHDVKFVITMDVDDVTMNNDDIKSWLNSLQVNIKYNYGHSKSKIEAVNADLDGESADVLLLASDDMIPQIKNYDDIIFEAFKHTFPDFDGAIKFNDGLRNDDLMTLCVMGWPLYKHFGYIYHPEYTSVYCDNEQTIVLKKMKKFAISDICLIKHVWTGAPWDELHARNENMEMYSKDKEVFDRHMREIFT